MRWLAAVAIVAVLCVAAVLLSTRATVDTASPQPPSAEALYPQERVLRYGFSVRNPTAQRHAATRLWAYLPVAHTGHQWVSSVTASHAYRVEKDGLGNQRMVFDLGTVWPGASRTVDIEVRLRLSPQARDVVSPDRSFLAAQRFVERDAPAIAELARELRRDTPAGTMRAIFDWVRRSVANRGYTARDRGALHALQSREGDCSEQMYLVTALARNNRIPARMEMGYVLRESAVLRAGDLHDWSSVWIDGRWVPVDTDRGVFDAQHETFVAMRILHPPAGYERQGFFGGSEGVEIRML